MSARFFSFFVVGCSLLLLSCTNQTEQKNNDPEALDTVVGIPDSASLNLDEEQISYNLPSALQIAYVFKKSGATFIPQLLNAKTNVSKYNTGGYKRAVNFGVYSADLAYCIFNKKYQESKECLKACKEMGSFLGLNQAFESDNVAQRFDKNIAIEDSVIKIVSSIQLKTDVMFEQNKQKHITVIAFTGAWVESMHIALGVYKKDKSKNVLANLMEQLLLSETVLKALKVNKDSEPEMSELISNVEKINAAFNSVSGVKTAIERDEEMDFNFMKITDAELKSIDEAVTLLRTSMIN